MSSINWTTWKASQKRLLKKTERPNAHSITLVTPPSASTSTAGAKDGCYPTRINLSLVNAIISALRKTRPISLNRPMELFKFKLKTLMMKFIEKKLLGKS